MKENKYNEVTGLTDKSTFHQFDQWENQGIHAAKNRYIYDFSFPVEPGSTVSQSLASSGRDILSNLSDISTPSVSLNTAVYGFPGDKAEILLDDGTKFSVETSNYQNFEETVNSNEFVPSFDKNALGHIDYAEPRIFTVPLDNWVDYFRSGYVEFTIKTNETGCIIASGTTEADANNFNFLGWLFGSSMDNGATTTGIAIGDTATTQHVLSVDHPYYSATSFDGALINLNIEISDTGKIKINYYDDYNRDNVNYIFEGNTNVADDQWHHVVINFGRPGLIKEHGVKFNKKFVEIWVDGKLDKRFDDKINEYQIFYPTVKWLFNNLNESIKNVLSDDIDLENSFDDFSNLNVGLNEVLFNDGQLFSYAVRNLKNKNRAFSGSIHTFAHGINIPISQYEIKQRMRLWKKDTKTSLKHKAYKVNANMVNPTITTNSKKALKLYWNNIVIDGKNGTSLDKSFQVESYSVTHQSPTSKTEIFNIDKSIKKENKILKNVRAAFVDNVIVNGPGMIYMPNLSESFFALGTPYTKSAAQFNPKDNRFLDSVKPDYQGTQAWFGPRSDLYMSGIDLLSGDRILLTNQIKTEENGIWIFNGLDKYLTRDTDSFISDDLKNYIVYVSDGYNKNTYWKAEKAIKSLSDPQKWQLIEVNDLENINSIPVHTNRWKDYHGEDRLINLQDDLNINNYDLIVFMNYPEKNDQLFENFPNDSQAQVLKQYNNFITSLKIACANGANLMVTSPKLAEDLGIVKEFVQIEQEIESGDGRSSVVNPFQFDEPAERYFDTHRQNAYHLDTTVPGLTDKETWVLTEAINYIPKDEYDYEQWHLKYSYRQFGLQEGNEFLIPSLPLRQVATKDDLPGFRANARKSTINAVAPQNVLAGTVVTSFANNHYHGSQLAVNEYDDYATTIIVHNGQQLGGTPINGKIFVNCVEDAYTLSRADYNKAVIQVIPNDDPYETNATKQWQYSTSRLNRLPKRINVKDLTNYGQTTPTNGGGGPLVQAATNSSNGIIRSETDRGNKDYQSDLYPQEVEEVYPLQEIPVLSMTWLGLQWLAGN